MPLISILLWATAIIPVLAFVFIEPTTLGWFESLGLVARVKNNDYVAGRFIAGGLAMIAGVVTMVLRKRIEVSATGIELPSKLKVQWDNLWKVETTANSRLKVSSSHGDWISPKDFRPKTLQLLVRHIVEHHPEIELVDEGRWLEQERARDQRWYRSSWFSTATLYGILAGAFILILGVIYFGFWAQPSGVPYKLSFVVTKVSEPKKLGWLESQGYYGLFDLNQFRAVEGTSYSGDVDSSDIEVILFDTNIWSFRPGEVCTVEVAKTAMTARLFVPRNGYYIKNVLSQSNTK